MSSANKDDKLVSIRASFGLWGLGAYWTLVEFVAEQLNEKSEKAEATLIVSELLGFFGCKRNKLESFLEHSRNISLILSSLEGNILKIEIPKLIEFADNYIKYDGKSLKSLQRHFKESSKQEEEIDKKKNIYIGRRIKETFTDIDLKTYASKIGLLPNDTQAWLDHNDTVGWVVGVGRSPMRDWQASLRTWKNNKEKFGRKSNQPPPPDASAPIRTGWTRCKECGERVFESFIDSHQCQKTNA